MTIRFVASSLLFHLILFLSTFLIGGPERWMKGTLFSVAIVTREEIEAEKRSNSASPEYGFSGNRSGLSPVSPFADVDRTGTIQSSSHKAVSRDPSHPTSENRYGALRGPAWKADAGVGTRICDNFQASIPVFLCNAKIYFGEL